MHRLTATVLVLVLCGGMPAYAPTRTVCSSGCDFSSVQEAVDGSAAGDVIELGAETFVENVSIIEKDLELRGAGPELTVVDGDAQGPVFFLDLHRLTTTTCCGPRGCRPCREEILYSVTLRDLTIRNGAGETGGGIEQVSGRLTVENCAVEENVAGAGGGILARGFQVEGQESLRVGNSVVRDNVADSGGGLYVNSLSAVITTTTISGNSGSPGALYFYSAYYPLHLTRSVVAGNVGSAAIAIGSGYPTISTSTISGNTGAAIEGYRADVWSSTITGNGSGIGAVYYFNLKNSIVAGNALDCDLVYSAGNLGQNLVGSSCTESGFWNSHPTDMVTTDPLLLSLADNGGPTQTHALRSGSPAIDTGELSCHSLDQRGVTRPLDGDGDGVATCDRGAFEFQPPAMLVHGLSDAVLALGLPRGIENALQARLAAAIVILGDLQGANDQAAAGILGAFVNQIEAQRGKKIPVEAADALIDAARRIVELVGWEAPGLSSRMAHGRIPAA